MCLSVSEWFNDNMPALLGHPQGNWLCKISGSVPQEQSSCPGEEWISLWFSSPRTKLLPLWRMNLSLVQFPKNKAPVLMKNNSHSGSVPQEQSSRPHEEWFLFWFSSPRTKLPSHEEWFSFWFSSPRTKLPSHEEWISFWFSLPRTRLPSSWRMNLFHTEVPGKKATHFVLKKWNFATDSLYKPWETSEHSDHSV